MSVSSARGYQVGSFCATGQRVETIFGQSPRAVVYTTSDRHLRWEYFENNQIVPPSLIPAILRFDSAMALIKLRVPSEQQPVAYALLGKALFAILDAGDPAQIDGALIEARGFIESKAIQHGRLLYIGGCFVSSLVFGLALLVTASQVTDPAVKITVCGGIAGILGTWMSITQRSDRLAIDPGSTRQFDVMQGASRTLLGILFGSFLVLASHADLILGMLKADHWTLIAIAVVAGFSERLVPDIIAGLERSHA
jgi:hypothetical protein